MKKLIGRAVISALLSVFALGFVLPVFGADNVWVVLVSYDAENENNMPSSGAWWYDFLTKFYDYDPNHILFLSSGTGSAYEKWKEDGLTFFNEMSGINGHPEGDPVADLPTKQGVLDALSWLQENSSRNDKVVFISNTHGGTYRGRFRERDLERLDLGADNDLELDGHDGGLCVADDLILYDGVLAEKLSSIKCRDMIVIINACYSGEFLWDIEREVKAKQPATKLRIITSASENDVGQSVFSYEDEYKVIATPQLLYNLTGFIINGLVQAHPIDDQIGYHTHKNEISVLTPDHPIEYAFEFKHKRFDIDHTKCYKDGDYNRCAIVLVTSGKKGEFNRDSWFVCPEWKGGYACYPEVHVNPTRTRRFFFAKDKDAVDNLEYTVASAGSIKINNDSSYTSSDVVTLSLPTTKSVSKMQFSNDGSNWLGVAEAYSPVKTWRLPTVGDGDVDGSGRIIAYDALLALKCAVGKITLTPTQFIRADVNGDGKVTSEEDAKNILKLASGKQRKELGLPLDTRTSGEFKIYVKFSNSITKRKGPNDSLIRMLINL